MLSKANVAFCAHKQENFLNRQADFSTSSALSTKLSYTLNKRNFRTLASIAAVAVGAGTEKSPYLVTEIDTAPAQREYNEATVESVTQLAPGVKKITLRAEISREYVALEKAYTTAGQLVSLKLEPAPTAEEATDNGAPATNGATSSSPLLEIPVCSAPYPSTANHDVLLKLKGDISAGATKAPMYAISVKAPLDLFVDEKKFRDVYSLKSGSVIQVGPFSKQGLNLRPIMFLSRFPTVLIFSTAEGIPAAKALIEAEDVGGLSLKMRGDVRLYYKAKSQEEMPFQDNFEDWQARRVKVRPIVEGASTQYHVGSFASMFDEDDLEYEAEGTAAVVCGTAQSNQEVVDFLHEAGIPDTQIVLWESP